MWKCIDPRNPEVTEFIVRIFKLIRGYGGGAISATQSIEDNFRAGSNFGNLILSCCNSKILLGMEAKDLKLISGELGLTEEEAGQITSYSAGAALLCAGANHIPIQVEASALEKDLFETRPDALKAKIERIRKEREAGQKEA